MTTKSAILYTDNKLTGPIFNESLISMMEAARVEDEMRIQMWSNETITYPLLASWVTEHIHQGPRGLRDCYEKIYKGLENTYADVVFLLEHDVLYPEDYFEFTPPTMDAFYFNRNIWRVNHAGYFDKGVQLTSNVCASRELLLKCYEVRMKWQDEGIRITWDEPGGMKEVAQMREWRAPNPTLDVRHSSNLTGYRTSPAYSDTLFPWGDHALLAARLGLIDPKMDES